MAQETVFKFIFEEKIPNGAKIIDFIMGEDETGLLILDQKSYLRIEKNGESYKFEKIKVPVKGEFPVLVTENKDEIIIGLKDKDPILVYNLEMKSKVRYKGPKDEITSIIMMPSKEIIITGSERYHCVNVWDMKKKKFRTSLTGPYANIQQLRKIDESKFLSLTEKDMELWDYDKKSIITFGGKDQMFHRGRIVTGNISEDKKRSITIDEGGNIKIMNLETLTKEPVVEKKMDLEKEEKIFDVKILGEEKILLLTSRRVLLYNTKGETKEYEEVYEEEPIKFAKLERDILIINQKDEIKGYKLSV